MPALFLVLRILIVLVLVFYVTRQVRRPNRWLGQPFAALMNMSHSAVTDWGLAQIVIGRHFTILDVGCGGGRTIQKLSEATDGKVYGIDYASGSVATARRTNAAAIAAGRVDIQQASVSALPFPDETFDLVTAVETQYYWPNLAADMREICRVLKPGGTLVVIAESYKRGRANAGSAVEDVAMRVIGAKRLSPDDERALFASTGFDDVRVIEDTRRGWLCSIGRKPDAASEYALAD